MKSELRAYRTFQALILGGLGIFLLAKIGDGRILLYINQRFVILSLAAAVALLFLAQAVMRARPSLNETRDETPQVQGPDRRAALWILALPLVVGLLVPQRALGASAASIRGIRAGSSLTANMNDGESAIAIPERERSILDWTRVFAAVPDVPSLAGQVVDVTGFVYHDPREAAGHFYVARFSVTCCVADAAAIGLDTTWPLEAALEENTWVRVRGKIALQTINGHAQPIVAATSVDDVQAPEQPYLFP